MVLCPPDFVVQINNFFSLVLFSKVIHKGTGKKLLNIKNCRSCRKSGNKQKAGERETGGGGG